MLLDQFRDSAFERGVCEVISEFVSKTFGQGPDLFVVQVACWASGGAESRDLGCNAFDAGDARFFVSIHLNPRAHGITPHAESGELDCPRGVAPAERRSPDPAKTIEEFRI
jgi:hypothetical protein